MIRPGDHTSERGPRTGHGQNRRQAMKNSVALVLGLTVLLGGAVWESGCKRQGPAERAGRDIDRAVEDMKDAVNPPGPAEKAGKKVDRAVEDVTR
jgi:hypothetical protein